MSTLHTRNTLLALLLAIPGLAQAASEREANHPIASGQTVEIVIPEDQLTGGAAIDGIVGNVSGTPVDDLDFFVFSGNEGDVVTLDIDGGAGVGKTVDTIMAVFGPGPTFAVLRQSDDAPAGQALDPGSKSRLDALITNFTLPASGTYVVGVSSYPRDFITGGTVVCRPRVTICFGSSANGDYTLLITGVSTPLLQISIDIKPGSGEVAPINPKSKGKIPVALLGSSQFAVDDVDASQLTFGHSGNEVSLSKCGTPSDVNGDAFPDMVCHFDNQAAHFDSSDSEAILRGELEDGRKFEGRGWLKVVPVKAQ